MLLLLASIDYQFKVFATIRAIDCRAVRTKSHCLTLLFLVEHDSVLGFHPFILFRRNLRIEQYPILVRHRLTSAQQYRPSYRGWSKH